MIHQFVSNAITPVMAGRRSSSPDGPPFRVRRQQARRPVDDRADLGEHRPAASVHDSRHLGRPALRALWTELGQYYALDAKTGKTLWTSDGRQAAHASVARAGDLLFSLESDGELVIARSSQTAFEPLRRYKVSIAETWAPPAISGSRILVKDVTSLTLWTLN